MKKETQGSKEAPLANFDGGRTGARRTGPSSDEHPQALPSPSAGDYHEPVSPSRCSGLAGQSIAPQWSSVNTSVEPLGRVSHRSLQQLTAFDSEAQLRAHIAAGGKPPSFRADRPVALGFALTLLAAGIPASIWS